MNDLRAASLEYLKTIEAGGDVGVHYAPDAVQHEHPNALTPAGARRDLAGLRAAAERGKAVVAAQRYEVHSIVAQGDQVAMRVTWRGTLKVPVGKTPAGGELLAHFGVFLRYRDGRIVEQHNYDCFPPF
ncbi:MAG: nuclear transport factor 2 family protein [Myxococcaceae bacterium]|nr:nuclear transport factor 2 family protein [Myxococcaceae bacterium]